MPIKPKKYKCEVNFLNYFLKLFRICNIVIHQIFLVHVIGLSTSHDAAKTGEYLTIIPRARVGCEMVDSHQGAELAIMISYSTNASEIIVLLKRPKEVQYLSSPAVFADAYRLRYL